MRISTRVDYIWNAELQRYIKVFEDGYFYEGPVALACGATSQQNQESQSQQNFMNQMQTQAQTVFGNSSSVFNDLMKTFAPIVAAGPSQQGFSPGELSNLNSQAITETGQSYRNAKQAVGEAESAQGGGNVPLPSGANIGVDTQLASSAANQTSNELSQITQANYATGRQNYEQAVQGLSQAPNVFNASTSADNAATSAGEAASNTANQIAQENNSWVSAVTGALGGIAGQAVGGWAKGGFNFGSGSGGGASFGTVGSGYGPSGNTPDSPDGGAS